MTAILVVVGTATKMVIKKRQSRSGRKIVRKLYLKKENCLELKKNKHCGKEGWIFVYEERKNLLYKK